MAINFSAQFIVNEKTSTRVLRLTDTSTGFTLSKGNFIVTFPDGSVVSNTDFSSPQISAPGGNTSISLITDTDNTVLTGTYVINYVAVNTSLNEFTKTETFDFNWEKPAKAIINDSDVVLPEVQFKDLTAYETSGSFTGVLTRNFYTTTPSTSEVGVITKTSVGDILTPSHLTKYYEGIYLVNSDISVAYTHTSKSWLTVAYTDLLQETFDVREAPTQDELVVLMNTYKDQIEAYKTTNPSQYEIMNEQYDLVLALYSHIIARYQTTTLDGSKAILDQLLGLLPPASSYTYKATQMLPFTINFTTSLTGSGTTGTLPKFTGTATLGDSIIKEDTNRIGIGKTPTTTLDVNGTIQGTSIVKSGGISTQFLKADGSVDANTYLTTGSASSNYQPLDGDLTAIAALAGAAGILTKVSANTWSLDTTSYQTLDADLTAIAALAGTSGILIKTAANTWSLDTTSYQVLDADLTAIAALTGTSGILIKTAANTWALDTSTYQLADADLTAIAALAGTSGLIRKTAANTYELDTSVYLTGINSGQITTALGFTPENAANKGVNNGYAGLDSTGKVPSTQLPSYVDDVLEAANVAALPATGETGKIYVTLDTNKIYRWTGSVYVEISPTVGTIWGGITGTLSNQTDLQDALNAKFNNPTGLASQYIRGDGTLAVLPAGGGGAGGGGVSYYLNGSINQGTIGGVTYYEMNKVPIIGTGTDFSISSNGYIASFLTDANDPALLNIPAGNWNFETYLQASNGGGSPSFYIELYKYDGTTFTLIASNSGTPKLINDGTSIEAYFSALAVPQTTLTLTDRLAIRIYVNASGRTISLHTENGHLCQVVTTFSSGLSALNGLTAQVQYFATGTSGTDFNISSSTATHTFNLPTASATNRGALSSADWITFNAKQAQLDGTGFVKASGTTISYDNSTYLTTANAAAQYQLIGSYASGSGESTRLARWISTSDLSVSVIYDDGTNIGIGQAPGAFKLDVTGTLRVTGAASFSSSVTASSFSIPSGSSTGFLKADGSVDSSTYLTTAGAAAQYQVIGSYVAGSGSSSRLARWISSSDLSVAQIWDDGTNIGIGQAPGAFKLDVTGTLRVTGAATFSSSVTASSFAIPSGSSTGFLKANGSVDSSTYLTTSGAAAQYQPIGTYVLGSGSGSRIARWLDGSTLAVAQIWDDGTNIGIGGAPGAFKLDVTGTLRVTGAATFSSSVTATSFVKTSGTSSQFLKADGSVDSTTYITSSALTAYLPLTGGTLTGNLTLSKGANRVIEIGSNTNYSWRIRAFGDDLEINSDNDTFTAVKFYYPNGAATFNNSVTATSFIKTSGTSSQFLKADGSVDSSTYLTTTSAAAQYQVIGSYAGGSGTSGRLARWISTTDLSVAQIWDDGTNIGIGQAPGSFKLDVTGTIRVTGAATFTSRVLAGNSMFLGEVISGFSTIESTSGNGIWLRPAGASDPTGLRITTTGSATFSSSVTASAGFEIPNGQFYRARRTSGNLLTDMIGIPSATNDVRILTTGAFSVVSGGLASFLHITDTGNVGIGTTAPNTKLEIASGSSTSTEIQRWSYNAGDANYSLRLKQDVSSGLVKHIFDLVNNGTTYSNNLVLTNGNVGIGTTAPTARLQISANAGVDVLNVAGFDVLKWDTGDILIFGGYKSSQWNAVAFATGVRMTILPSGNVGIGTSTDAGFKLDVNGSGRFTSGITAGSGSFTSDVSIAGTLTMVTGTDRQIVIGSSSNYNWRLRTRSDDLEIRMADVLAAVKFYYPNGAATFNNTVTATAFFESSDKTIKTLIEDNYQTKGIESVTAKLYLKNGVEELGYFAQDLQGILPSAVTTGENGLLNLSYREVHTAKIARLEKEVEQLKAQLNLL
jgi:hypothetical protein